MVVVETIQGIGALKNALDIAKTLKNIDEKTQVNEAIIDLQQKILDAQADQLEMFSKLDASAKEVEALKAWDEDKKRYKLSELRPNVMVYRLTEGADNGEPSHLLCPSCYLNHHKSILTQQTWEPRASVLICHDCGWYGYESGTNHPNHQKQRPEPYRGE